MTTLKKDILLALRRIQEGVITLRISRLWVFTALLIVVPEQALPQLIAPSTRVAIEDYPVSFVDEPERVITIRYPESRIDNSLKPHNNDDVALCMKPILAKIYQFFSLLVHSQFLAGGVPKHDGTHHIDTKNHFWMILNEKSPPTSCFKMEYRYARLIFRDWVKVAANVCNLDWDLLSKPIHLEPMLLVQKRVLDELSRSVYCPDYHTSGADLNDVYEEFYGKIQFDYRTLVPNLQSTDLYDDIDEEFPDYPPYENYPDYMGCRAYLQTDRWKCLSLQCECDETLKHCIDGFTLELSPVGTDEVNRINYYVHASDE